jgi:hypothetical protein
MLAGRANEPTTTSRTRNAVLEEVDTRDVR